MNINEQRELENIKQELKSIVNELYSISSDVRKDNFGIGNDTCADGISRIAGYYNELEKRLERMDVNALSDEFILRQKVNTPVVQNTPPVVEPPKVTQTEEKKQNTPKEDTKTTPNTKDSTTKNGEKDNSVISIIKGVFKWLSK